MKKLDSEVRDHIKMARLIKQVYSILLTKGNFRPRDYGTMLSPGGITYYFYSHSHWAIEFLKSSYPIYNAKKTPEGDFIPFLMVVDKTNTGRIRQLRAAYPLEQIEHFVASQKGLSTIAKFMREKVHAPNRKKEEKEETKKEVLPEKNIPKKDIPEKNISKKDIPEKNIPKKDIPEKNIPKKDIPEKNIPKKDIPEKKEKIKPEIITEKTNDAFTFALKAGDLDISFTIPTSILK
jgi:hypothetical protein